MHLLPAKYEPNQGCRCRSHVEGSREEYDIASALYWGKKAWMKLLFNGCICTAIYQLMILYCYSQSDCKNNGSLISHMKMFDITNTLNVTIVYQRVSSDFVRVLEIILGRSSIYWT